MARWARGETEIEQLIARRELERITGAAADGQPLLAHARRILATATTLSASDPYSAYVLAYDAARHAILRGVAALTATWLVVKARAIRQPALEGAFRTALRRLLRTGA